MKVIYIAGPFRAGKSPKSGAYDWFEQHHNIIRAERVAHQVWAMGAAAVCPHLNTAHFQGSLPDKVWLTGDLAIMEKCDAVLMMEDWARSKGATAERTHALQHGMPVLYSLEELKLMLMEESNG